MIGGRKAAVAAAGIALALALTSCAGSRVAEEQDTGGEASSGGMIPQLTFEAEFDASIGGLVNYNPFAPKQLTKNWLYEPLMIQNSLTCEVTPWLATGFKWEDPTRLVFDIRPGVKWSDGSELTAKDVAFTYNLAKKYPAIDTHGVWTDTLGPKATSVEAQGNQVVFTFAGPAAAKFNTLIGVLIVSEKEFGDVGDPTKFVSEKSIATGPFKVGSYNGRRLELQRRDDYWQADQIKVEKLVEEGNYDANQAALKLRNGELDFYTGEIPNPQKTFVDADPNLNHVWYAPAGMTVIAPMLTKKPFTDVKFREAVAYGIDKESANVKARFGLMEVASQSGLPMPAKADMLPQPYTPENTVIPFDQAKANQMLDDAGYTKNGDGKRQNPDGSPISLTMSVQAGWIDYEAAADQVVSNLRNLGIDIKLDKLQPDTVDANVKSGKFEMMVNYMGAGCDYANGMGATLSTKTIPTKTEIKGNVGRFSDPTVDAAVAELAGTTDEARTKELVGTLVNTMMTQYPVIPVFYAPARALYRTDKAVGWPSAEDPYANPQDNARLWMAHLRAPNS